MPSSGSAAMERGAPSSVTGPWTPNLIMVDVRPVVSPPAVLLLLLLLLLLLDPVAAATPAVAVPEPLLALPALPAAPVVPFAPWGAAPPATVDSVAPVTAGPVPLFASFGPALTADAVDDGWSPATLKAPMIATHSRNTAAAPNPS